MMIEDARAFLQGSEQITMAAMSKAIAMALDPATHKIGTDTLEALKPLLKHLSDFAIDIGTAASGIAKDFGNDSDNKAENKIKD